MSAGNDIQRRRRTRKEVKDKIYVGNSEAVRGLKEA